MICDCLSNDLSRKLENIFEDLLDLQNKQYKTLFLRTRLFSTRNQSKCDGNILKDRISVKDDEIFTNSKILKITFQKLNAAVQCLLKLCLSSAILIIGIKK